MAKRYNSLAKPLAYLRKPSAILLSLSLLACAALSATAQAQQPTPHATPRGLVAGRITERVSGQPVVGARVVVERAGASRANVGETQTDAEGNFRLELAPGVYALRINADGYAPLALTEVGVTANRTTVKDAQLGVLLREEVEVRSGFFPATPNLPVSNARLSRQEIRATPGTGGDVLRAIGVLPGVTNSSAEFADLIVRGGAVGENITFLDNIPVGDFTLFTDQYDNGRGGRLALLAPETVERLDFSAGGFGARYGDRMSSALDIRLRSATRDRVQGTAFLDSGSFGGTVEIPLGARGGWLFSARRSYLDIAFDFFDIGEIGRPRNFDFINRADYDLSPRHRLSLTAINTFERFTLNSDEAFEVDRRLDRLVTTRSGRRAIVGLTLSSTIGARAFSQLTAWGIGEHADGAFARLFDIEAHPVFGIIIRTDRQPRQRARDLRDAQFGLREELTVALSPRLSLAAGGALSTQQANHYTFERSPFGYSPFEEEALAPTREHRFVLPATTSAYAYTQATWRAHSRLSITPGLRVDRYGLTAQTLVSPRASARLHVSPRLALNFAAGIYRQPPTLFVMSLAPENRRLRAQSAAHFIAGAEWLARENLRVTFEAYRKSYNDLIVRRTPGRPVFANEGEGDATGFELVAQRRLTGSFGGQLIYSFTRSRRRLASAGFSFPADTERPQQLTLIGLTRLYGFGVGGKFRAASGLPLTPRVAVEFAPGLFLQRIARPEDRNTDRLPAFVQLDAQVERRFSFRRWSFAPHLDVFNLMGRANIVELDYDLFRPFPVRLQEGKALPIFGARIEF